MERRSSTSRPPARLLAAVGLTLAAGVLGLGSSGQAVAIARPAQHATGGQDAVVRSWLTTPDAANRLTPQPILRPQPLVGRAPAAAIRVDPATRYQSFVGAGASITGSSAHLLMSLPAAARGTAMRSLFGTLPGAGISLLRQPIGASDFALTPHTYDDLPSGRRDPQLHHFSVAGDETSGVLPLLREARELNPHLTVIAAPWSAPAWMKTSQSLVGGTLEPSAYRAYAAYLVRFVTAYRAHGVPIAALSLQNEPGFSPPNYPGMTLSNAQQSRLLGSYVGPAFRAAGLHTTLLVHDHNWDTAGSALSVLNDATARRYAGGTAFHCYAGEPADQDAVHREHPGLPIYQTECGGGTWSPRFGDNLWWTSHNLLIQATRHWSSTVATWNIALNPSGGPTFNGGTTSRGVLTIDPRTGTVTRNVEYDVLAHIAAFVVPGARRISSVDPAGVETTAWQNPDGAIVLIAHATGGAWNGWISRPGADVEIRIPAGGLVTYTW